MFGVSALDFIARRREQLWPSVPVVFAAIDEATMSRRTLPKNVTGATMQMTLHDMVNVARIVMPNLKAVAMVGDPLERQTFYRHFVDGIPAVAAQLEIVNLMDLPLAELAKRLAVLPDNTVVLYTGIYFTSEGVSYVPAELTSQIAQWANRPVVVTASSYLNKGAIGGYIVQSNPIGQQAGRMALRVLAGENHRIFRLPKSLRNSFLNGPRCNGGTSARAACRRGAKSSLGSQRRGNGIHGRLHLLSRFF